MAGGVRQGCPLSALLFVMYLDPLLRAIAAHPDIRGFSPTPGLPELTVMAYADDVVVMTRGPVALAALRRVLSRAEQVIGLRLNQEKTVVHSCAAPRPLVWPVGAVHNPPVFRHLGVVLHPLSAQIEQRGHVLGRAVCAVRDLRDCTGNARKRAILANAFVWGRVAYFLPHLPWPQSALRALDRLLGRAVWGAPRSSVAASTLTLPTAAGGVGLVSAWLARIRARWRFFQVASTDPYLAPRFLRAIAPYLPATVVFAGLPPLCPLPPLMREVVADVRALSRLAGLSYVVTLSPSQLAAHLVTATALPPRPRRPFSHLRAHPSLQRALRAPVREAARTFYVKLHLDMVPVAAWLLPRGCVSRAEAACRHCFATLETVAHLFLSCPFFAVLRARFRADVAPARFEELLDLLFPSFRDQRRYVCLLTYLWVVWSTRMSDRPHDEKCAMADQVYGRAVRGDGGP